MSALRKRFSMRDVQRTAVDATLIRTELSSCKTQAICPAGNVLGIAQQQMFQCVSGKSLAALWGRPASARKAAVVDRLRFTSEAPSHIGGWSLSFRHSQRSRDNALTANQFIARLATYVQALADRRRGFSPVRSMRKRNSFRTVFNGLTIKTLNGQRVLHTIGRDSFLLYAWVRFP